MEKVASMKTNDVKEIAMGKVGAMITGGGKKKLWGK